MSADPRIAPQSAQPSFDATLAAHGLPRVRRGTTTTLQVNVGRRCDLACHHCHVEAGPRRTETMDRRTADRVLSLLESSPAVDTLDLTGGAPELNDQFRHLVAGARALESRVIDRCNLTVLLEPGQEDTVDFLAAHRVHVIASLPCYTPQRVDVQRGRNVFERSIEALRRLNAAGYGNGDGDHRLDLVYNPTGPTLPPAQPDLESEYREALRSDHGIGFDALLTITNMPIKRFAHQLEREGQAAAYQALLVNHFNPANVPALMCRDLVSVSYDGRLYDCDFNQMLELPLTGRARTVWDVADLGALAGQDVATQSHCFGCTAGAGSSCGGALAPDPRRELG